MLNDTLKELFRRTVAEQGLKAGTHRIEFGTRAVRCVINADTALKQGEARKLSAALDQRAEGDPGADGEQVPDGTIRFTATGTASSTSVDAYGTEMSFACLQDMAEQFTQVDGKGGIELFVGHGNWGGDGLEWSDAIGRTIRGEVQEAPVVNAADPTEKSAVCVVEMQFEADADSPSRVMEACKALKKRLARGLATGLSIGGWFRSLTYMVDDEGYISRIVINKVDLDHLATTRRPANPDCLDMDMVRSALQDAVKDTRAMHATRPTASAPVPTASDATPAVREEPASPVPTPAKRKVDPEDPKLEDSDYEQPPHDYVTDIKANWPEIWEAGGNIRGNDAYELWSKYLDGDRSETVLDWVVEREGWAARHYKDFELPGVMAQLKWGAVGEKGWDHQKQVIEDRKKELEAEDEDTGDEASSEESASAPESNDPAEKSAPAASEPAPDQDAAPAPERSEPADTSDTSFPSNPSPAEANPADRSAQPPMETNMQITPELRAAFAAYLAEQGLGTAPTPAGTTTDPSQSLDEAGRRGSPAPTAEPKRVTPPAGADVRAAKGVINRINQHQTFDAGSTDRGFVGEVVRTIQYGQESFTSGERAGRYLAPTGERVKATWLGLAHEVRSMGLDGLADIAERAAGVLAVNLTGYRALARNHPDVQADIDRVGSEGPALLHEVLRTAVSESHPVFKEPGAREAAARALTVSATSDKVTTAMVSSLLQQLSNLQLGARTQLRRVPGGGTAFQTPKRTVSSTLAEFVADGSAPTEDSGAWDYDTWNYKTLATRMKVTRKAIRQGAQWGDILANEAMLKGEDFAKQEEIAIFQGDTVHSLPTANGFNGLITLVGVTSGQTVANTTVTAGDVLSTKQLDVTISKVRGRENKANMRIFASERGRILLNTVLQVTQQFTNMNMVQAGFVVETYNGIPIVESSGIPDAATWNGSAAKVTAWTGGATTAIVVVNLNHVYMVVLTPLTMEQVATTTAQYAEYEMFTDEVLVLDNAYGAAVLGGIKVE